MTRSVSVCCRRVQGKPRSRWPGSRQRQPSGPDGGCRLPVAVRQAPCAAGDAGLLAADEAEVLPERHDDGACGILLSGSNLRETPSKRERMRPKGNAPPVGSQGSAAVPQSPGLKPGRVSWAMARWAARAMVRHSGSGRWNRRTGCGARTALGERTFCHVPQARLVCPSDMPLTVAGRSCCSATCRRRGIAWFQDRVSRMFMTGPGSSRSRLWL